jgi:hypothetical protein
MKKHIILCGSMIFVDKMQLIANELDAMGYRVTCPKLTDEEKQMGAMTFMDYIESLGGIEKVTPENNAWKIKGEAIKGYKKEIDASDAILVCNFDKDDKHNRIGENSFLEMGYAFFMNKAIYVLQGPPYGDEKIEEVLGMTPIFLYGEVHKIKNSLK